MTAPEKPGEVERCEECPCRWAEFPCSECRCSAEAPEPPGDCPYGRVRCDDGSAPCDDHGPARQPAAPAEPAKRGLQTNGPSAAVRMQRQEEDGAVMNAPAEWERWADNCARAVCLLFPHIPGLDPDLSHSNVAAVLRVHVQSALAAEKARTAELQEEVREAYSEERNTRDCLDNERELLSAAQAEIARLRGLLRECADGWVGKYRPGLVEDVRSAIAEKEDGDAG